MAPRRLIAFSSTCLARLLTLSVVFRLAEPSPSVAPVPWPLSWSRLTSSQVPDHLWGSLPSVGSRYLGVSYHLSLYPPRPSVPPSLPPGMKTLNIPIPHPWFFTRKPRNDRMTVSQPRRSRRICLSIRPHADHCIGSKASLGDIHDATKLALRKGALQRFSVYSRNYATVPRISCHSLPVTQERNSPSIRSHVSSVPSPARPLLLLVSLFAGGGRVL